MRLPSFYILLIISTISIEISAQTCCSGGVPLSGNVGMPSGQKGMLQFSLTYDDNVLKTLKSGTEKLDDSSRTRHTRSAILQIGYQFSDRFSVDIFQSYVFQERLIRQNNLENRTRTNGYGDLAVLFKYKWLVLGEDEHTSITSSIGVKLPTGPSDLSNTNGFGINADLQPGSGAWDGIFWTQAIHHPSKRKSSSWVTTLIYNAKGTNRDYLGAFDYRFGDEFQWHLSYGDRFAISKILWDPHLRLQYRYAAPDKQDNMDLFSTGGQWLFARIGNNFWLNSQFALRSAITLPLFAKVEGTQLSPSYRLEFGIFTRLMLKKKSVITTPQQNGIF